MAAGDIITVFEGASGRKGNYYDGTDDYVLHDAHAVARVTANDTVGTYTAWIYVDSITDATTNTILSAGDNNATTEYLQFSLYNGAIAVFLKHGGATQFNVSQTTASISARKWHHVAVVQNGTRPTLYVDGKVVAMTDTTATDLTFWYDELTGCDKFAIGVLESNATHTADFKGAIGRTKYFAAALSAKEILTESREQSHTTDSGAPRAAIIETARVFDVTYEDDGITDSGSGADNGTLTGNAIYGGYISDWSYVINQHVTGHAAEFINTVQIGRKLLTVIKRGD